MVTEITADRYHETDWYESPIVHGNMVVKGSLTYAGGGGAHNFSATTDPGVGDDVDDGYGIGSIWINTTTDESWRCVDSTSGAAVWVQTSIDSDDLGAHAFLEFGSQVEDLVITSASSPKVEVVDTTNNATGFLQAENTNISVGSTSNHSLALLANSAQVALFAAAGTSVVLGIASNNFTVTKADDTKNLQLWGGNAANTGGGVMFYGSTHATKASDVEFWSDSSIVGQYDASAPEWIFNKDLAVTVVDDTAEISLRRNDFSITAGNILGRLSFKGDDTTANAMTLLAAIEAEATSDHFAGDNPTDLVFYTTPDASDTVAEVWRIDQTGQLVAKDAAGPAILNEAATSTNPTLIPNQADLDTGIGWVTSNQLAVITAGTEIMRFKTGEMICSAGSFAMGNAAGPKLVNEAASSTNPTVIPNKADEDTGIGWVSADQMALIAAGTYSARVTNSGIYGSNAASAALLTSIAATATVPTVVPNQADLNTGVGWVSADRPTLVAGGVQVFDITSAGAATINSTGLGSLTLSSTSTDRVELQFVKANATAQTWGIHVAAASNDYSVADQDFYIVDTSTAKVKLVFDRGTGIIVGDSVGGINADGTLHVWSGSAGAVTATSTADDMVVEAPASGGISVLGTDAATLNFTFGTPSDNTGGGFAYDHNDAYLKVYTGVVGHEVRLMADNDVLGATLSGASGSETFEYVGNLGRGRVPTDRLDIVDSAQFRARHEVFSTTVGSRPIIHLGRSRNAAIDSYTSTADGDALGSILFLGVDSGNVADTGAVIAAAQEGAIGTRVPTALTFSTYSSTAENTDQLVLRPDGSTEIVNGIKLGGTAAANLLDDYEEGTFTPVLSDGTNNATHATQLGYYTKKGNTVKYSIYILVSSLGSVSGATRITGLPFTCENISGMHFAGSCANANGLAITAGHTVTAYVSANQTYVTLHLWDATTGTTALQESEITADGSLMISGEYQTAA